MHCRVISLSKNDLAFKEKTSLYATDRQTCIIVEKMPVNFYSMISKKRKNENNKSNVSSFEEKRITKEIEKRIEDNLQLTLLIALDEAIKRLAPRENEGILISVLERINDTKKEKSINVSVVCEKDYENLMLALQKEDEKEYRNIYVQDALNLYYSLFIASKSINLENEICFEEMYIIE